MPPFMANSELRQLQDLSTSSFPRDLPNFVPFAILCGTGLPSIASFSLGNGPMLGKKLEELGIRAKSRDFGNVHA